MDKTGFKVLHCILVFNVVASYADHNRWQFLGPCNNVLEPRILGGEIANLRDFLWMVLLKGSEAIHIYESGTLINIAANGSDTFHCSGSLISKQYVVTAAHCVDKHNIEVVRVGEYNLNTPKDCTKGGDCLAMPVDIGVEKIEIHEKFNRNKAVSPDIAVIKLKEEVQWPQYQSVCLPDHPKEYKEYIRTKAMVAGWGVTENGTLSPVKIKLEIEIQSIEECPLASDRVVLCAGGEKEKDSCHGDSGGPLMYLSKQKDILYWELIGIVSGSALEECGVEGLPVRYTKVDEFLDWISGKIDPGKE